MAIYSSPFFKVSSPAEHVLLVEMAHKPVNAISKALWTDYSRLFDSIGEDGDCRVVVLASSLPKAFTAGIDLVDAADLLAHSDDPGRRALEVREHLLQFQHAISATERIRQPVICAIHGLAIGLAVDMAAACDVRYAAENAIFSIKEAEIGLAADIGTLARLPRIIGNMSLARELAFTARNFTAAEAKDLGLVSKVVPGGMTEVVGAAVELAKRIAVNPPFATNGTKRILLHSRDHTVAQNLEYTATWNGFGLQSLDPREGLKAMKARKPGKYAPMPKIDSKL